MAFKFFDKNLQVVVLNLSQVSRNFQINFINKLLENLKEEGFILHLNTIFGVFIYLICHY